MAEILQNQEQGVPLSVSEPSNQAVAVLGGRPDGKGIRVLDVSEEYLQLWGGNRDDWLGAPPKIVHQEVANTRLLRQLSHALSAGKLTSGYSLAGMDRAEETVCSKGLQPLVEWRVTAMSLPGHVENALVLVQRDITERVEKEAELKRLATTDMLTGLMNRSRFDDLLKHELGRLGRYMRPFSLIMLDIDFFKTINDSLGHDVGDQVLHTLATQLESSLRSADYCARWGGEEFIILAPETSLQQATRLAEKIRRGIASTAFQKAGCVTVSLGVAEATLNDTPKSMMKRVDNALYQAKESGRDQVAY
ncbi:diguanylate cyclase [Vreelandella stevensii]|uniref:diguanylate cyclase n=1 Tax=Vreelandella stevensii TaxID=502821 RepID=UPI00403AF19C